MTYWNELYERPRRLTPQWGHCRIFAPEAYRLVRNLQLVPIVSSEAMSLAAYFPIVWHMREGGPVLCALRSLLADGRGHPVKPTHKGGSLPIVLSGFPVIVMEPAAGDDDIWIDDVVADQPTDIGAPILMEGGRLGRGAAQRVQATLRLRQAIDMTQRLTDALADHRLLEPWPLDFEGSRGGQRIRFEGLMAVRSLASPDPALIEPLRELGVEAATLIAAHRISLFRISILLQAARTAIAAEALSPELVEAT